MHLRPDWETVIGAVIDVVVEQPIVDAQRIVLSGWSLGGHLAPRAASVEHRIAALVADPALADVGAASAAMMVKMGVPPDQAASIEDIDQGILDQMMQFIEASPAMRWSIVQRGFWVNGVSDLRAFLRKSAEFTLADRIGDIRCATLVTRAQNDQLAAGVQAFYDALTVQKTLLEFTAAEGAGDHCEMFNRSLLNGRVLDWLDDTLA
jgi:acetyl esterase/lipase